MTYKKQLRLYCEFLWSFIIRSRAGFRCEVAGEYGIKCNGSIQAMHLVTRGVKGIKYDRRNGRSGCAAHHVWFTYNPHIWMETCNRLWNDDWKYLNDKKWQRLSTEIDKEGVFVELMLEAKKYESDFPEYIPKIRAIESWISNVAEGKTK